MSLSMNCYLQQEEKLNTKSSSTTECDRHGLLATCTTDSNNSLDNSSTLDALLSLDTHFTRIVAICAQPQTPLQKILRAFCHLLEITGHGVPWFVFCGLLVVTYWYTQYSTIWVYLFNVFIILVADIVVVAPIKLYFQRPRPKLNRGSIPLSVSSVDKYAFPSGHTSRCVALAILFCFMSPFHLETNLFCAWAGLVSISRVLIGRHHILDVLAGILAGIGVFELTKLTLLIL